MKTKFLVIALALPLVFGCEKSDVDDNGGKDNTEQDGNAGGYDPDKDDPMTDLPPLEDVDDVCTKMVDRDFMTYCYDNFDVNKDGKVSMLEANAQSNGGLVIECNTAADFTGIEYFTNLTKFKSSSVRTLNLGYNKKLVSIDCSDSPLEAIDLRYNTLVSEISFRDCWKLTKVLFADEAPLESVGGNRFSGCSSLSTLSLPDNCKTIGEKAFYKFTNLSKIKFPKNLESIGSSAFSGCSGLTSVTFPDGLTSIGDFAFSSCSGLTSVTFPDSLTSMGRSAFSGCPGKFYGKGALSDNMVVVIDDILFCASIAISGNYVVPNCKAIGSSAFSDCSGLTSVTFPDGLTSISDFAFM
ncbi:MAG: leucine-rich repeat domain-containing protein, partial [Bacteroidales bacterium]|nr:leucine-rich repeat domain-containing protein [Bacteroidales bacterium]